MISQFPFSSPFPITPSEADQLSQTLHYARSALVAAHYSGTMTHATSEEITRVIKQSHALIQATRALLATMPTHNLHGGDVDEGRLWPSAS